MKKGLSYVDTVRFAELVNEYLNPPGVFSIDARGEVSYNRYGVIIRWLWKIPDNRVDFLSAVKTIIDGICSKKEKFLYVQQLCRLTMDELLGECDRTEIIRLLMIAHLVIEEPIMLSQQHKQPIGQEITVELRESFRKPTIQNVVSFTKSSFSKRSTANNIAAMLNQADQVIVIEEQ